MLLLFLLTNTSSRTEKQRETNRRGDAEQTQQLLEITRALTEAVTDA